MQKSVLYILDPDQTNKMYHILKIEHTLAFCTKISLKDLGRTFSAYSTQLPMVTAHWICCQVYKVKLVNVFAKECFVLIIVV